MYNMQSNHGIECTVDDQSA